MFKNIYIWKARYTTTDIVQTKIEIVKTIFPYKSYFHSFISDGVYEWGNR